MSGRERPASNPIGRHIPWVVGLLAFLLYLITACPTVYFGDSGELIAAAESLGVAHPPGYPLYTLLGRLFAMLPLGGLDFRMNLLSVVCSGLAAGVIAVVPRPRTLSIN